MTVFVPAAGRDRPAFGVERERVHRTRVQVVELLVVRHFLFDDEHLLAHGAQRGLVRFPAGQLDAEAFVDHRDSPRWPRFNNASSVARSASPSAASNAAS